MKRCSTCRTVKNLDEFHRNRNTGDGRSGSCKECAKDRARTWHKENPERAHANALAWARLNRDHVNTEARRRYRENPAPALDAKLRYRYKIDGDQFRAKVFEQHGLCAICQEPPPRGRRLHVDHDHATGRRIRKLLCGSCNQGLGMFRDNPDLLRLAAQYIDSHQLEKP